MLSCAKARKECECAKACKEFYQRSESDDDFYNRSTWLVGFPFLLHCVDYILFQICDVMRAVKITVENF